MEEKETYKLVYMFLFMDMSKTLCLVRHGQTYFNLWHKIQGRCDSPLTKMGINQSKLLREFFLKMVYIL